MRGARDTLFWRKSIYATFAFDAFFHKHSVNHNQIIRNNGYGSTHSESHKMLTGVKPTTDTAAVAADIRQPAMERKAGEKEEASWENHSKEARTVQEAAEYEICIQSTIHT
jgi:hypothetical protein